MATLGRSTLLGIVTIGAAWLWASACGEGIAEPNPRGWVRVSVTTTGGDLDLDGYDVTVDVGQPHAVGPNEAVLIPYVAAGTHTLELSDVASNCTVSGPGVRPVSVADGDTTDVAYAASCVATGVQVVVATSGVDLDPDGYLVSVDGAQPVAVPANGTVSITRLRAGSHHLSLDEVAANCDVDGENPRPVQVVSGTTTTEVVFTVACAALGSIRVTMTTAGVDFDATGYTVAADGAWVDATRQIGVNETGLISGLPAGDYTVILGGLSFNCDATSPTPVTVTVPSGATVDVSFSAECRAAAQLAYSAYAEYAYSRGIFDIYTVSTNGAGLTKLTSQGYGDAPAWSPDRLRIAFRSSRDGNPEIYVMNADGSAQVRLTDHPAVDYRPSWSPDGARIAFRSDRDGNPEIYVMNADGTNPVRLTNHPADDADPAWSPDGTKIAFSSGRAGIASSTIHVMNSDGSGVTELTTGAVDDAKPTWSPDGTRIAFSRVAQCYGYYCERDLFVMNADGSGVTQLTSGDDDHHDPAWSPDGVWIAFNAAPCQYFGCSDYYDWSLKAVRSNATEIRELGITGFQLAWRP